MNASTRFESAAQVAVLLLVGSMAGAASFTHVHDWTMANSPAGTGDRFGWANAVISELTPSAAALEIRRRRRNGQSARYPVAVLVAAAALSIGAQLAVAKPGLTGGMVAAIPALAFLALTKLVLSRPSAAPVPESVTVPVPVPAVGEPVPADVDRVAHPAAPMAALGEAPHPRLDVPALPLGAPDDVGEAVPGPAPLLAGEIADLIPAAREAAGALISAGEPLTRVALAARMRGAGVPVANRKLGPLLTHLKAEMATA